MDYGEQFERMEMDKIVAADPVRVHAAQPEVIRVI